MLKSASARLNHAMPAIVLALIGLVLFQLIFIFFLFAPFAQKILYILFSFFSWVRFYYPPLALFFLLISLWGALFDLRATSLAKKGLFLRKTILTKILQTLTHRQALDDFLARKQRESSVDTEEFSAFLRTKLIGQDPICEEISHHLRRRLALRAENRPAGAFLLKGPGSVGKNYLCSQIASFLDRPFLPFEKIHPTEADRINAFITALKTAPNAIIVIEDLDKIPPVFLQKLILSLRDGSIIDPLSEEKISCEDILFFFTSEKMEKTDAEKEISGYLDRVFTFPPLSENALAKIVALEIEKLIQTYGLQIAGDGIDPDILFHFLKAHHKFTPTSSAKELTSFVAETIEENLILAKQSGAKKILLEQTPQGLRILSSLSR